MSSPAHLREESARDGVNRHEAGLAHFTDDDILTNAGRYRDQILAIPTALALKLSANGVPCEAVCNEFGHWWIQLADGRVLDCFGDLGAHVGFAQLDEIYLGPPTLLHLPAEKPCEI